LPLKKFAIITTHPIQYNAPWFKLLTERGFVQVKVFYTWGEGVLQKKYDPGFGQTVEWDIPLLDGYDHCFVENVAVDPGSHHFKGIDNPGLVNELEGWNPDALLVFGWSFKSHLKVLRHFKGKRTILFRGDSTLLDEVAGFSMKKLFRRLFLKWVYSHIDIALYVGSANKAYYLANGVKAKRLLYAPHAIDNNRFMQGDTANGRGLAGIPQESIVFMFAGKMEAKKDPILLLDAFIRLTNRNAHLLVVGNGVLETELKEMAGRQTADTCSRIHFLPFQNQQQMPAIYRMADVFVLPSKGPGETWGLAVNEAMACSGAVLVSNKCGCAADLVAEGINGFIFKSGDENDLLNKMEILCLETTNLKQMGEMSLQRIQTQRFEKICEAVEGTPIP
jgi:glycosyltransferase involved in cell wall biosynthesis